jgi:accessory colonization factor AcfC
LQEAVLLKAGAEDKAAQAFLDYIKNNEKAKNVIKAYGYELP